MLPHISVGEFDDQGSRNQARTDIIRQTLITWRGVISTDLAMLICGRNVEAFGILSWEKNPLNAQGSVSVIGSLEDKNV